MPFFHGTASEFQPGDRIDPGQELGARRGQGHVYATTDQRAALNYGRYKAMARHAGYGEDVPGRAYEVEPAGSMERDDTVDERFGAWRTASPMRVIREIEPEREAGQ